MTCTILVVKNKLYEKNKMEEYDERYGYINRIQDECDCDLCRVRNCTYEEDGICRWELDKIKAISIIEEEE